MDSIELNWIQYEVKLEFEIDKRPYCPLMKISGVCSFDSQHLECRHILPTYFRICEDHSLAYQVSGQKWLEFSNSLLLEYWFIQLEHVQSLILICFPKISFKFADCCENSSNFENTQKLSETGIEHEWWGRSMFNPLSNAYEKNIWCNLKKRTFWSFKISELRLSLWTPCMVIFGNFSIFLFDRSSSSNYLDEKYFRRGNIEKKGFHQSDKNDDFHLQTGIEEKLLIFRKNFSCKKCLWFDEES